MKQALIIFVHNLLPHHSETDTWKKDFLYLLFAVMQFVIRSIYSSCLECFMDLKHVALSHFEETLICEDSRDKYEIIQKAPAFLAVERIRRQRVIVLPMSVIWARWTPPPSACARAVCSSRWCRLESGRAHDDVRARRLRCRGRVHGMLAARATVAAGKLNSTDLASLKELPYEWHCNGASSPSGTGTI